jgi:ribulose-bisphosphate carboxylase large chain
MAHPSLTGAYYHCDDHGIAPGVLLGTVFRILGADISVFPNFTGRFSFTRGQCMDIRSGLEARLGHLAPAFPSPAGGIEPDHLAELAEAYGEDAVYLIGASLLGHANGPGAATSDLLERIRERFPERLEEPERSWIPAQEPLSPSPVEVPGGRIEFQDGFSWKGRPVTSYKGGAGLPFRGVVRHELIGRGVENTRFDLRYFEIEPGGFSSLEKHRHTHTIICVRGRGALIRGGERIPLEHLDVAYVAPLEPHQLRNETDRPFGFFCIVDKIRDRPVTP